MGSQVQREIPRLFSGQSRRCLNWSWPITILMNILHITIKPSSGEIETDGDRDRDRDTHWNTGLNSLGPNEKPKEGEREQGRQDQREPSSDDGWR